MPAAKKRIVALASVVVIVLLFAVAGARSKTAVSYPDAPHETIILKTNPEIITDESKWTTNNTHDPEIIKENGVYYVYSTDYMAGGKPSPGIQIRKSSDLIQWKFAGRVFDEVPLEAAEWTMGGSTFWAPEVVKMNNRFYLYYSVSQVGSRNSYIGVAVSDSPEGPWKDLGAAVTSKEGDGHTGNAIDSSVVQAEDGSYWMSYGSYFGGIFLVELNPETGLLKHPGEEGKKIAQRKNMDYPIEAPSMFYNRKTDMYYLMTSYGWLEDTYNVRVARSENIEGPYVDVNGRNVIDPSEESWNTGTKIVGSYSFENDSGWLGTGHSAFLQDGEQDYILHNARAGEDKYWSHLHVRKVFWTKDGWPVASPERYAGEGELKAAQKDIAGTWEYIRHERFDDAPVSSADITLEKDGSLQSDTTSGRWSFDKNETLLLEWNLNGEIVQEKVILSAAWDWENWKGTLVFTGLDDSGTAVWGKKSEK